METPPSRPPSPPPKPVKPKKGKKKVAPIIVKIDHGVVVKFD